MLGVAALGEDLVAATASALWRLDPESGAVEHVAALPHARTGFAVCAVGPVVLLVGGRPTGAKHPDGRLLACDLDRGVWRVESEAMEKVEGAAAAILDGVLHVLGGSTGKRPDHDPTDLYQIYDPRSGAWARGPKLPGARSRAAAFVLGDHLHVVGGRHHTRLHTSDLHHHHVLDAAGQHWNPQRELPKGHVVRGAAHGSAGHAVLHKARDGRAHKLSSYDRDGDEWRALPDPIDELTDVHVAARHGGFTVVGRHPDGRHVVRTLRP